MRTILPLSAWSLLSTSRSREERFLVEVEVRDGVSGVVHWNASTAHLTITISEGEGISSGAYEPESDNFTEKGQH